MHRLLEQLQNLTLAAAIRGDLGDEWLYPSIETLHVLALAVVYGSILVVDLRLIGLASRDTRVSALSAEMLPWTWSAFGIAALCGALLFLSKAATYFYNPQFELKFLCMALAALNLLIFRGGVWRQVARWDGQLLPPPAARAAGLISIACWSLVIVFGRWTGFTT